MQGKGMAYLMINQLYNFFINFLCMSTPLKNITFILFYWDNDRKNNKIIQSFPPSSLLLHPFRRFLNMYVLRVKF